MKRIFLLLQCSLRHNTLQAKRSIFQYKNLWLNIITFFILFYVGANFIVVGLFIDKILKTFFPDGDVTEMFTTFFTFYLLVDIVLRILFQKIPTSQFRSYLHLPVKTSDLLHLQLIKSALHFQNIIPFLVIIPFLIEVVYTERGISFAVGWLLSISILLVLNNYFIFFLKTVFQNRFLIPILIILGMLIILISTDLNSISDFVLTFILRGSENLEFLLVPISATAVLYFFSYQCLKAFLYIDSNSNQSRTKYRKADSYFLRHNSVISDFISLELKLITRNNRPKSLFISSLLFMFYGLFIYHNDFLRSNVFLLIGTGMIMTGFIMMNYGQFLFCWESTYFDHIMSQKIAISDYLTAKFKVVTWLNILGFTFASLYGFIDLQILYVSFACFFFNLGISSYFILFFGFYNMKRIDLGKGIFLNYEGVGFSQLIMIFFVFGLPILIYLPFHIYHLSVTGLITLSVVGGLGWTLRRYVINKLALLWGRYKYQMLEGFRTK